MWQCPCSGPMRHHRCVAMPMLRSDETSPLCGNAHAHVRWDITVTWQCPCSRRSKAHAHVRRDITVARQCPCSRPMRHHRRVPMPMLTSDETSLVHANAHAHTEQGTCSRPPRHRSSTLMPMLTSRRGLQRARVEGRGTESNAHSRVRDKSPLVGGARREPYSPHRRSAGQQLADGSLENPKDIESFEN